MKTIEIVISPAGETKLETKGFSGPDCRAASQFLEHSLGHCLAELLTPEFHQVASQSQPQQQSN